MFGLLNLNKPAGWTSRDAVNRVQRLVKPAKVGHAGTLDPLATGVLILCVGPATRLISHVQQQPKAYDATFLLGRSSPSDDTESEVSAIAGAAEPTLAEIEAALPPFLGSIEQLPPQFSALKVNGKRAYELARRGEVADLKPRTVDVYALEVLGYEYPELRLSIRCGSGTYVRSIGRDLAQSLGTGAVMSALTRTAIGEFDVGKALEVENINLSTVEQNLASPLLAAPHLRRVALSEAQLAEIRNGRMIAANDFADLRVVDGEQLVAIDTHGELVALLSLKRDGKLGPTHNFPQPS